MTEDNFDVIIVGGGPGGYVAAIRAAQLGMKPALVERAHLGGICLNWGCIPTKALLSSADVFRKMKNARSYGLVARDVGFDLAGMVARSREVANRLRSGVAYLLKKNKVAVFEGQGRLNGRGMVSVTRDGKPVAELRGARIILATGARPRGLPGLEPDGNLIWTYKDALVAERLPKRLLVVGAGAIGVEFASFFHTLGSEVVLVEAQDRVLPTEDEEISALACQSFEKQGMKIRTNAMLRGVRKGSDAVTVTVEVAGKPEELEVDRVLLAVGIVGNVEDLGLENTAVVVEKTHVVVNPWAETGEPGVYAIGDLAGPPWLAHKASHEAIICVEKIAGVADTEPLSPRDVPGCIYCHPQVASVGLSEKEASERGYRVRVGRFPFAGNGKAVALGETEGMMKTVFDEESGELLGAHVIGAEATELIASFGVAKTLETTEVELMRTIFPHPSLSEMVHEAVLSAFDRAIHI